MAVVGGEVGCEEEEEEEAEERDRKYQRLEEKHTHVHILTFIVNDHSIPPLFGFFTFSAMELFDIIAVAWVSTKPSESMKYVCCYGTSILQEYCLSNKGRSILRRLLHTPLIRPYVFAKQLMHVSPRVY